MPAKRKPVKRARTARPAKLTARSLLYDNERIVHRAGCKEISACACPVLNQYNLPLDADHNCICPEAPKPHAQHTPADDSQLDANGIPRARACAHGCVRVGVHNDCLPAPERTETERRAQLAALEARAALKTAALKLVEQLALYWIDRRDEPGSTKEAMALLNKHGYRVVSVGGGPRVLRRPDESVVTRPLPDVEPTLEALQARGIISSPPVSVRAGRAAGSSPALRIACPVVGCERPPGEYCIKANEDGFPVRQTIAHKKRRELEEKTR